MSTYTYDRIQLWTMPGLRDVDIRQLAALDAVARQGSFGRAADALGFSQAAVSQQVAALERAAGTRLFDRPGGPRPAVLTPAGTLLLDHARAVLARLDQAERHLADLATGVGGRLDVGTFQSASVALLPLVVADLRREAPEVDITLHESDDNEALVGGLLSDEFDVTFFMGPRTDPRVEVTHLCHDPFVVVTSADACPLDEDQTPGLAMPLAFLDGYPMVGAVTDDSGQMLVDEGLRGRGIAPRYVFRSGDNAAVQAMVAVGMGAAVMPLLAVDQDDPSVHIHPLDPPLDPRDICVAVRRDRTVAPSARRMVQLALRHIADVAAVPMTVH